MKHLLLIATLGALMTACGAESPYTSAFDRQVQLESEANLDSPENTSSDDGQSKETQPPANVSLFEKVLQTSEVPEQALFNAFEFFDENQHLISNKKWITIFDIGRHSSQKRFFMINMENGEVFSTFSAHGKNSDTDADGYATKFSNVSGSKQSSLGFMLVAETYSGKYGYSVRMDGLEARNSKVRSRAIVIHGANYVNEERETVGRSWGCPALSFNVRTWVIDRIHGGSLFYSYHAEQD